MSEKCDRCKSIGEDRRTIWMDCFYDMNELGIPLEKKLLFSAGENADFQIVKDGASITLSKGEKINLTSPTVQCNGDLHPKHLFTLRVCKRCRAEWLGAVQEWFQKTPQGEDHDADDYEPNQQGSGIFVRENGINKEISEEEWYRRNPGREPVRVKKNE